MLDRWFRETPLGRQVAAAERHFCAQALGRIDRGHAAVVGAPLGAITRKPGLQEWELGESGHVIGRAAQLPFRAQSLDALLLVHVLDFSDDPDAVLAQAYQCLRSGGTLVALTFNPISLWGARRLVGRLQGAAAPWGGSQWLASSVGVYMRRHGFETEATRFLCFLPPGASRLQNGANPWEYVGPRLGRLGAGVQATLASRQDPGVVSGRGLFASVPVPGPRRGVQPAGRCA